MLEAEERLALAIRRWERHPVVGSGLIPRGQLEDLLRFGHEKFGSLNLLTILERCGKVDPQDIANCIWPNIPFVDADEIPPVPDDLAELTNPLDAELQGFLPFERHAGRIHIAIHDLERNLGLVSFQLNHGPVSLVAVSPLAFRANLSRWFESRGPGQSQGVSASTRSPLSFRKDPLPISWRTEVALPPIAVELCSRDQGARLQDIPPDSHAQFKRVADILREKALIRAGYLIVEESTSDGSVMDDCRHCAIELSKLATDHIVGIARNFANGNGKPSPINSQNLQTLARSLALENRAIALVRKISCFQSNSGDKAISDDLIDDLNENYHNLPDVATDDWGTVCLMVDKRSKW